MYTFFEKISNLIPLPQHSPIPFIPLSHREPCPNCKEYQRRRWGRAKPEDRKLWPQQVCTVPSRLRGPVCAYFPHHPPTPYFSHHPAATPAAATTIVAPASPARAGLSRACKQKSPEAVAVASLEGGSYSAPPILIFLTSLPFPRTHHLNVMQDISEKNAWTNPMYWSMRSSR